MKKALALIGLGCVGICAIVFTCALAFGAEWATLAWNRYFGPKHEEVRRQVFEATRSYNQAKIQELSKHRLEYLRADDPNDKAAIASTVRIQFADYDPSGLPVELQQFLKEINQ